MKYVTSPSGVTEANCTAQSRPAAQITWNVGGDNRTLGPPISSEYDLGDGTTIVTSTLLFQSGLLSDLLVKCNVHHKGLEKPLTVSLYTDSKDSRSDLVFSYGKMFHTQMYPEEKDEFNL